MWLLQYVSWSSYSSRQYTLLDTYFMKQLEDMKMDEASEEVAVQLAAQGVIGKRVDEMESGFMMALDYMIQTADNDQDDKVVLLRFLIFFFSFFFLVIFP